MLIKSALERGLVAADFLVAPPRASRLTTMTPNVDLEIGPHGVVEL